MTKQDFLEMVQALPDDTPFDLVAAEFRKSCVIAEIRAGIDEIERGDTVSHEEMKRRAAEWKSRR